MKAKVKKKLAFAVMERTKGNVKPFKIIIMVAAKSRSCLNSDSVAIFLVEQANGGIEPFKIAKLGFNASHNVPPITFSAPSR